jgi:DNA helicase HerA-like ATPase/uncharacterized protein YcfJ
MKSALSTKNEESTIFAWNLFDNMISKSYLDFIPEANIIAADVNFSAALKNVRVDKITKIVYDKDENNLTKLNNVFSAIYSAGSAVFILLKNSETITDIYIGVRGATPAIAADSIRVLEHALTGNFPGMAKDELDADEVGKLSDYIRDEKNPCLACITGVPSLKEEDTERFTQGLEKIIDAMGSQNYAALLLAEPVSRNDLDRIEEAYQNIYSDISILNISQLSLSEQESYSLGRTITKSFSESLSRSIAQTHTISDSTNTSTTSTESTNSSRTKNWGGAAATGASVAGAGIGAAVGSVIPVVGTLIGAGIGGAIGGIAGGVASAMLGSTTTGTSHSEAETTGNSHSESDAKTETSGNTITDGESVAKSENKSLSSGSTYQYEVKNKRIVESLKILDEQLERIRSAKNYGAWNWAAYFIAPDQTAAKIGANIFTGILKGENSGIERNAIALWTESHREYKRLTNAVSRFQHPQFLIDANMVVAATALLSTPELTVGMSLPQKSLPGIPVFEAAEFGRSVSSGSGKNAKGSMEIGAISHMGLVDPQNTVALDIKSLTSHTFVTGSTGSGKSNSIYMMLDWLHNEAGRIPFLVIEPAKGEYKNVFGGYTRSVNVYGTNPYHTPLLRLNPFAFPLEIHVMEHIDRLIEILNAVWPMYAAMPAILKEAVEQTYKKCGWDLLQSKNKYAPATVFPDFHDLLDVLPEVINSSKYAEEVKSNYSGALLTRIKSLTNGYYKTIFQKDEIPAPELFDKSCIVDISRIGSSETKSLLMGFVFLKLHEYRMAKAIGSNVELKHITVLEEAHHLLRKTSTEQGMESANLQGKSVEMLTNAIAEMRTYGEGFIIADQAPGLLDPSVIRNTNTKIVLRLPDFDDRALVGKAQNLNDAQIEELARLKTGCASVYQNNWQEAVLCQFKKFDEQDARKFDFLPPKDLQKDSRSIAEDVFIQLLLKGLSGASDFKCLYGDLEDREQNTLKIYYPDYVTKCLQSKISKDDLLWYLNEIVVREYIDSTPHSEDISRWTTDLLKQIFADEKVINLDVWLKDILLASVFNILAIYDNNVEQKLFWSDASVNYANWRIWE